MAVVAGERVRQRCGLDLYLDKVPNCHSTGNSVRVDNDVRCQSFHRKRHILLSIRNTHRTLLSVTTSKLVANLWCPDGAYTYFGELGTGLVGGEYDTVDDAVFTGAQCGAGVALGLLAHEGELACVAGLVLYGQWCGLANDDVVAADTCTGRHQSVVLYFVVAGVRPHAECGGAIGLAELFLGGE